jgi:hypothetical protein
MPLFLKPQIILDAFPSDNPLQAYKIFTTAQTKQEENQILKNIGLSN